MGDEFDIEYDEDKIEWLVKEKKTGHITVVKPFPIGIDYENILQQIQAAPEKIREEANRILVECGADSERVKGVKVVVGIDRLDYTKSIKERVMAYAIAVKSWLNDHPGETPNFVYLQATAKSRFHILAYRKYYYECMELINKVNKELSIAGWQPILISDRLKWTDAIKMFNRADIALITPGMDGMNIVAKEAAACGAIPILSVLSGAASELNGAGAVGINPYRPDEVGSLFPNHPGPPAPRNSPAPAVSVDPAGFDCCRSALDHVARRACRDRSVRLAPDSNAPPDPGRKNRT